MATDPNPALRAELEAAQAVIEPQIRGLDDLKTVSISDALRGVITSESTARRRRNDLIQAVIDGLDATLAALEALEADGYPALPPTELTPDLFDELQGEEDDLDAAVAVFASPPPLPTVTIELGEPIAKSPSLAKGK